MFQRVKESERKCESTRKNRRKKEGKIPRANTANHGDVIIYEPKALPFPFLPIDALNLGGRNQREGAVVEPKTEKPN